MDVKPHWLIAGGTGIIGSALTTYCICNGYRVTIVSRNPKKYLHRFPSSVRWLDWSMLNSDILKEVDACINLAGQSIACYWTQRNKQRIYNSRINSTIAITDLLIELGAAAPHFLSASGVSIYNSHTAIPEQPSNEQDELPLRPDWFGQLAMSWEAAANKAVPCGLSVCNLRFSPVLTMNGGILPQLYWPIKCGLGGPIGTGQQPFSWIGLDDAVSAIAWIIKHKMTGPVNLSSPHILTQAQLSQTIAKKLKRPCMLPLPQWLVTRCFGEMGRALMLKGQYVTPHRLLASEFTFSLPEINDVIAQI